LINLGDDNLKCLHPDVKDYYNDYSMKLLSQFLKMEITPASKNETMMSMKKITEIIFLKRTPRFIESLDRFMGALNLTSIYKSLCWKDTDVPEWEEMVVHQAKRELSLHPKDEYRKFCLLFNIVDEYEDVQKTLLTYSWNVEQIIPIMSGPSFFTTSLAAPALTKQLVLN